MKFSDNTTPLHKEHHIHVLLCEPGQKARILTIPNKLEALQKAVGGYIEAVYPFEDPVAIICNEEGKLNGMALNRALRDDAGQIQDILAGPFLIAGLSEDNFASLSQEYQDKYYSLFAYPEMFFWDGNQIQCIQIDASN